MKIESRVNNNNSMVNYRIKSDLNINRLFILVDTEILIVVENEQISVH